MFYLKNLKLMVEIKEPRDMAEDESSFHVVVGTGIIHKKCRTMQFRFRIDIRDHYVL
jgi:hypothetical protein